jgi:hypothetical protein
MGQIQEWFSIQEDPGPQQRRCVWRYGKTLHELSYWISGVEADEKGTPVLLKY